MVSPGDDHPSRHRPDRLRLVRPLPDRSRSACGSSERGSTVATVRCPSCASLDDKVVDSRTADDGSAIRRRRQCLTCGHRFTTFERTEEQPLVVVKRSGDRVAFDRAKVEAGVVAAAKGRPITLEQIGDLAAELEDQLRLLGNEISSEQVGLAVLERLRDLDQVTYVRFASVYKGFDDPADFQREVRLLTKTTAPKRH
jgi:transcriptional repressor NrdR